MAYRQAKGEERCMTYQEQYNKLMKHAEQFGPWAEMQKKLGMAISRPSKEKKK